MSKRTYLLHVLKIAPNKELGVGKGEYGFHLDSRGIFILSKVLEFVNLHVDEDEYDKFKIALLRLRSQLK